MGWKEERKMKTEQLQDLASWWNTCYPEQDKEAVYWLRLYDWAIKTFEPVISEEDLRLITETYLIGAVLKQAGYEEQARQEFVIAAAIIRMESELEEGESE